MKSGSSPINISASSYYFGSMLTTNDATSVYSKSDVYRARKIPTRQG
ncbi:hypothetical protein BLL52_0632 [Rhodoferax antarcticus ANT.BR]|uniref:Uncharacterized protein n=1 Tax=Rhodoferax antarcticus ANT.BR TaxID=1111071 RepID=A0A1Q8YJ05_9BURK|nr:hypothetical protein BLL52_0632 [Rhodoferax antarcticus ANT.BR]